MTLLREEGSKLLEAAKRGNYHLEPALGRSYALTENEANIDLVERTFSKEPMFNNGSALVNSKQRLLYRLAFIDNPASVYPRFRWRLQSLPVGTMFATTVVFFSVIPVARAADDGDDFANNLFSDLAPILALFGEQVTKQFLSESSGWADNILFAMAPLGVITGIVSAIRVAGPPWLKALVGRGKEGLAQAELELMSSNSPDVGEMWNGQAIVRVLGKPSIFQFVYTPDTVASDTTSPSTTVSDPQTPPDPPVTTIPLDLEAQNTIAQQPSPPTAIIESEPQAQDNAEPQPITPVATSASESVENDTAVSDLTSKIDTLTNSNIFFERQGWRLPAEVPNDRGRQWDDNIDIEMRPLLRRGEDSDNPHILEESNENNPPNISLNARGKLIGNPEKWSLAVVGIIAQLMVLIFDSFITYHPRLRTRFLKDGSGPSSEAFPCTIFGTIFLNLGMLVCSYVVDCASTEETWVLKEKASNCKIAWVQKGETVNDQVFDSYLIFGHEGQQEIKTSQRCHPTSQLKLRFWVLVATSASIAGFVTQFIGLRGMHWSATIAQLAATILMTALRSFARRRMTKEPTTSRAVKGYELDSMARKLKGCLGWKVISEIPYSIPAEQRDSFAQSVMLARKHLEHLSGWSADVQDVASAVCTSMEKCLNYIHQSKDIHLRNSARESVELRFTLAALALKDENPPCPPLATSSHHYGYLPFKLTRPDRLRPWRMSEDMRQDISAVLSLWKLHAIEEESDYNKGYILPEGKDLDDIHTMAQVLAWPSHKPDQRLFSRWMGSHDIEIRNESPRSITTDEAAPVPTHRFIGAFRTEEVPSVAIYSGASVKHLFAQQIFSMFLSEVLPLISEITGPVERILDGHKTQELRHSAISHLVEIVSGTGLGTRQEILMIRAPANTLGIVMIAHLGDHKLLPPDHDSKRACIANFRMERTLRKSRLDNKWDVTASHILNLLSDYYIEHSQDQYNITAHQNLSLFDVLCMTRQFVTRICCFLRPAQVEENHPRRPNHPRALFLQWLTDINMSILESLPRPSFYRRFWFFEASIVDKLILNTNQFLDPKTSLKADIFLRRFVQQGEFDWPYNSHISLTYEIHRTALRFSENMLEELDRLANVMDFEYNGEGLLEVLREATEAGDISVLEALTDFNPNLRHPESSSLAKLSTRHAEVARHLLTQFFWYFPLEYRQFQIKQQPVLLLNALIQGDDKLMTTELLKHITSGSRDSYRQTCLILAASADDGEMVTELLKHGANIDRHVPGSYNGTWMLASISRSDEWMQCEWQKLDHEVDSKGVCEVVRLNPQGEGRADYCSVITHFLKMGNSSMAVCAISVRTALQAAAEQGHIDLVKQLLKAGARLNTAPSGRSWRSALQAAAGGGHLEVVRVLLEAGADVNEEAWGFSGRTALQAAAEGGYVEVADLLISRDADIHAKPSSFGRTALQAAAQGGHLKIVGQLLEHNADVNDNPAYEGCRTALQAAAEGGYLDVVERLLQQNADVNAPPQKYGLTALQAAAGGGYLPVVDRLLKERADPNAGPASHCGRTALQAAASGGHLAVVDRLLDCSADISAKPSEEFGLTALQAAAGGGHLEVVDRLLDCGAVVNAENSEDHWRTALQAAAGGGYLAVVDRLIERAAAVSSKFPKFDGQGVLQAAAGGGHLVVVDQLLKHADTSAMFFYMDEQKALETAAGNGHLDVVDRLLERAATTSTKPPNFSARGPLQAAAGGGHLVVIDQLLKHADTSATSVDMDEQTALKTAAGNGHLDVVDRLLERGVAVSTEPLGFSGWTTLQTAAGGGHLEVVDRLLEHNLNTNDECSKYKGRTSLQAAAEGGHLEVVNRLLDYDMDVNAEPSRYYGRTALQGAAGGGHLAVVNRLLDCGADISAKPSKEYGLTALQAAAGSGYLVLVDRLIACGTDINEETSEYYGRTALQAAAGGGHLPVVDRLIERGAAVNAKAASFGGRTALQAAARGGHLAVVNRLLEHNANTNTELPEYNGQSALEGAAEGGHLAVVDRLLKHGADVNVKPAGPDKHRNQTALQAAARGGYLEIVDLLLRKNVDVNAAPHPNNGRTALQAAAERGHLAVVNRLLECHADVNAKPPDDSGLTALQAAAEGGHLAVVNRLLECHADVNAKPSDVSGRTALQAAAGGGHLAVVNRLLECHADVNAKPSDDSGRTALQAAAEGGHLAVVSRLLECHADVNAKPSDKWGRTALQAAAEGGHLAVVNRLLEFNTDVNADGAAEYRVKALEAAQKNGHKNIVERLLAAGAA